MHVLERKRLFKKIQSGFQRSPIVSILGPRQCGKTTLARLYTEGHPQLTYYDLSKDRDVDLLANAYQVLEPLRGLIVIDEIQKVPQLFSVLRVLADRWDTPAQFLILGSSSPDIIEGVSESLAGRVAFVDMGGFSMREVHYEWNKLWLRGGFPRSFLGQDDDVSFEWRQDYVRTFVERDIPSLGYRINAAVLKRFLAILSNYHGKIFNASQVADMMDLSSMTIKKYLDIFEGSFLIYVIPPWFENIEKRQVKAPKVYFRDTGLLHFFHSLPTRQELLCHPCMGFSFEGLIMDHVIRLVGARYVYFWKIHSGAELDIFINKRNKRIGIEAKFSDAPKLHKSMKTAQELLKLDKLYIVYPGDKSYPLAEGIETLPIVKLLEVLEELELG